MTSTSGSTPCGGARRCEQTACHLVAEPASSCGECINAQQNQQKFDVLEDVNLLEANYEAKWNVPQNVVVSTSEFPISSAHLLL